MLKLVENKYRNNRPAAGITMLEMMIIVVIIGIAAAMAVPTFMSGFPRLKARTEARNVLNFVRLARSKAISDGMQYGVYLDTANKRYLLFRNTSNPGVMSYDGADMVITGPQQMPADITASSTFTGNAVVFESTGRSSQSGNFVFNTMGGGNQYIVSVLASTGRSKLQ